MCGDDLMRISVPLEHGQLSWPAGAHFFLRFGGTGIHALTSHPFTASNVPAGDAESPYELVFHVKARKGVTSRLASSARSGAAWHRVWVDGPYGGLSDSYTSYDRVIILVGGSGEPFQACCAQKLIMKNR